MRFTYEGLLQRAASDLRRRNFEFYGDMLEEKLM